jgi:hypothetical protein
VIAGIVVLSVLGFTLTLLGGRARESLIGGMGGLAVGVFVGIFLHNCSFSATNHWMLIGAIGGATFAPWARFTMKAVCLLARIRVLTVREKVYES